MDRERIRPEDRKQDSRATREAVDAAAAAAAACPYAAQGEYCVSPPSVAARSGARATCSERATVTPVSQQIGPYPVESAPRAARRSEATDDGFPAAAARTYARGRAALF